MSKKSKLTDFRRTADTEPVSTQRRVALLAWLIFTVFAAVSVWNAEYGVAAIAALAAALAYLFSRPPLRR
jgi:hypothetical protein